MTSWLPVDLPAQAADPEMVNGVEFRVVVSPYDRPEAVRGYWDDHRRRFVIEFRYMGGTEATRQRPAGDHVTFDVGRHSDRLYRILVDTDSMGVEAVALKMDVLGALQQGSKAGHRDNNRRAVREALQSRQRELFECTTV